jgi:hypothetical protein
MLPRLGSLDVSGGEDEVGLLDEPDGAAALRRARSAGLLAGDAGAGAGAAGGTRAFHSRFLLRRRVWVVCGLCAAYAAALLVGAGALRALGASSGAVGAVVGLAAAGALLLLALAWVWNRQDRREYDSKVNMGLWTEGVFVFSTGDVVVRFTSPFRHVELEFEGHALGRAEGDDAKGVLTILYMDSQGRPKRYSVRGSQLVHRPSEVAACINGRGRE